MKNFTAKFALLGVGISLGIAGEPPRPKEASELPPGRVAPSAGAMASMAERPQALRGASESTPELAWRRADGRPGAGPVKEVRPVSSALLPPGAPPSNLPPPEPVEVTRFDPGQNFKAALPLNLRNIGSWVSFTLSGAVHEDPDKGATVSIDGARVGFKKNPAPEGVRTMVHVVVQTAPGKWEETGLVQFTGGATGVATVREIIMVFNETTWDFYNRGRLLWVGIPYARTGGAPEFTISPGEGEKSAAIENLKVGIRPAGPPGAQKRSTPPASR